MVHEDICVLEQLWGNAKHKGIVEAGADLGLNY